MSTLLQADTVAGPSYVSTGTLPPDEFVATLVSEAHKRFQSHTEGKNSKVYPALARVPSELFGICVVATSGKIAAIGDTDYEFAIMSVSKPFVFALVCQEIGPTEAREKLGANSTGLPFNSLSAIERTADGRTNPMVNAGAIATTSLVPGIPARSGGVSSTKACSRFAGRTLPLNEEVYASASETNFRNRSIAKLLQSCDRIYCDPAEATDSYTRQCSLNVSAKDLGGDGRHACRWRRQSAHQGAGRRPNGLPLRVGGHGNRRVVRDLGRLALRHRTAGQKRHRRRHRDGVAGQGWIGHLRPAPRRGR